MATRTKKAAATGSAKVKELQEKQIVGLENAYKRLADGSENLIKAISEAKEELNNLYYEIQSKEQEIVTMDASAKEARELADANALVARQTKVDELKANIKALEKDYKTKYEDFEVSFNLKIRESKENTLNELLSEFGLAYISNMDLATLREEVQNIEERLKAKYKSELSSAMNSQKKAHDNSMSESNLLHKAEIAELEATAKNAERQVEFYKEQVAAAEARVQAILDNQARIAEAGKGITVNATK